MYKRKNIFILIITIMIVVVLATGLYFYQKNRAVSNSPLKNSTSVENFYQCVAAGFPSTSDYPRQCQVPNGPLYFEDLFPDSQTSTTTASSSSEISYNDLIKVSNLKAGDLIKSPVLIKGEARGTWYFEAVFPITILDSNGLEIGHGQGRAIGDWMSSDYVPFEGSVIFTNNSEIHSGKLVLKKDNPSGDPARDDSFIIPVKF